MIENQLNYRELGRIEELFHEGKSCEHISQHCMDADNEENIPCRQAIRTYLSRSGIWPQGTPRPGGC